MACCITSCSGRSGSSPNSFALTLSASAVTGGAPATGTIDGGTQAADKVFTLTSSDPSVATVPQTVTIKSGQKEGTFQVSTVAVNATKSVTITATSSDPKDFVLPDSLTVNPPEVASVTLSQTTVVSGATVTATVTLNGPAPFGGVTVMLVTNDPAAATVPVSVTLPTGATKGTFPVETLLVASTATPLITATLNGGTADQLLTVNPPVPAITSVSPAAATQGSSPTITVTGTGLTSDTNLIFPNGSGISYADLPVVSADGTAYTVKLNVAANAATGPVMFFARSPGGSSGDLTLTVNSFVSQFRDTYLLFAQGLNSSGPFASISSIKSDGNGGATGWYDLNNNLGYTTGSISGSYTVSTAFNNFTRIQMIFTSPSTGPFGNAIFSCNLSADGNSGDCTEVDGNGNGVGALLYRQDPTAFNLSTLGGPYAFGVNSYYAPYTARAGQFTLNGATGGVAGSLFQSTSGIGPTATRMAWTGLASAPDPLYGRAPFTCGHEDYIYYVRDANTAFLLQTDPLSSTNSTGFAGIAARQRPPFGNPLMGTSSYLRGVLSYEGRNPVSGGPSYTVGQLTFGPFGLVSVVFDDDDDDTIDSSQTAVGSGITFDIATGIYSVAYNPNPRWMGSSLFIPVDSYGGFSLETTPGVANQARFGTYTTQQQPPQAMANSITFGLSAGLTPGGPPRVGAAGYLFQQPAPSTFNGIFDRATFGSTPVIGLTGALQFGAPDATGRGSVTLPGNLFGLSTPTFNGTYYSIDSSHAVFVGSTPTASGGAITLGHFGLRYIF
jgi:hypothetical protein